MTKLSVNINKVATLRNARGKNNPDVVATALNLIQFGAQGITVHPRPDERHITKNDVFELKKHIYLPQNVEFNIEGFPSDDFIALIAETRPEQATLVPDPPDAITSNAGWNVSLQKAMLESSIAKLKKLGTRVSIFIDPDTVTLEGLKELKSMGADRIELYTEQFAQAFNTSQQMSVLNKYIECGHRAISCGLGLNAGHDLDSKNLNTLITALPDIEEVSIGHALIADALYWGYEKTIQVYLDALQVRRIA